MLPIRRRSVWGFTLVEIMIVVGIIALVIAIAIPGFMRAREVSRATSCQENLIKLEGAVDSYALDYDLHDEAILRNGWNDIVGKTLYLKKTPVCRGGGEYVSCFKVGTPPTCTYITPDWFDTRGELYSHTIFNEFVDGQK
jgi:prepilin-type N-terminal cleavage/methylation domain-containing protein